MNSAVDLNGTRTCKRCECKIVELSQATYTPPSAVEISSCKPCFQPASVSQQSFKFPHHDQCFWEPRQAWEVVKESIAPCGRSHKEQAAWVLGDSKSNVFSFILAKVSSLPINLLSAAGRTHYLMNKEYTEPVLTTFKQNGKRGDVLFWVSRSDNFTAYGPLVRKMIKLAKAKGMQVVIVHDIVNLPLPILDCVAELPGTTKCAQDSRKLKSRGKFEIQGVSYFDLGKLFCGKDICDIVIPGTQTIGLADKFHLNEDGIDYASPFLCNFLKKMGID